MTLDEAKAHLRLDHNDENDLVTSLIATAQAHLDGPEGILSRVLMDSEWQEQVVVTARKVFQLRRNPVTSIVHVRLDGALISSDDYSLRYRDTGMAIVVFDEAISGELVVRYRAGAIEAADVPAPLIHAMKLHISSMYEVREMELVGVTATKLPHYDILVEPYRRRRIG